MRNATEINFNAEIKAEGKSNFVTTYDKLIQDKLFKRLKEICPEADFLGEESNDIVNNESSLIFVVDPIDGTTNFCKNYNASSISIGLLRDGIPILGVIYNPYLNEIFTAEKDKGSFCNNVRIKSSNNSLENSLVGFGTAGYNPELYDKTWEIARKYYDISLDIRRSGSAALEICNVACGRTGCYFELMLAPWDFVAGACIIKEAGGIITDEKGNEITNYYNKQSIYIRANKEINLIY